ncbi:glycoside hydrolase family 18 protein [Mycena floridula]|nr:glycoside hydrolase family 18 protein [Mycena floridula]
MRPLLPLSLLAGISTVLARPSESCNLITPRASTNIAVSSIPEEVLVTAWYPGWLQNLTPANISWNKYTAMTFAFAVTTNDPSVISLDDASRQALPGFVAAAKSNNVSALLSIGGWTGSLYYSNAVATADNRTAFVNAILALVDQYQLDGIDFDWEYPNKQGIGCNTVSSSDSDNFLAMLQSLRSTTVGRDLYLSAAVGLVPWNGPDGTPLTDVSGFAEQLNHIAIMNYDVWGPWSPTTGPNAPLDDSCLPAANQVGSAVSAVAAWTEAGFPANQIALGIASYGHSFHVDGGIAAYAPFDKALQPLGNDDDASATATPDECGNIEGPGGDFDFFALVDGGFLTPNGTAAPGIQYLYDECSQTPFVYNPTTDVLVSYDDATSLAAKGKFINDQGLLGFAMWQVAGDSDDILLDAISGAMGIQYVC